MTSVDPTGPGLLAGLADTVRRLPGVLDAAAVARRGLRAAEPPRPDRGAPRAAEPAPAARGTDPDLPPVELYGGDLRLPDDAPRTLQEGLRRAAELAPDKGTVYIRTGREDVLQTYRELLEEAQHVLGGLRAAGLRPGDAALFVFDDNRGYLTAFWACVLGGFVPTPVAVATTYATENETNRKLLGAWRLLDRPVLVTDAGTAEALAGVRRLWDEPDVRVLTVEELAAHPADKDWFPADWDSPVLNLLTSGSTGVPKCVQHTNSSVVSRSFAVARHCGLTEDDISLIWMPFDHVTVAFYNIRDVFLRCLHVNAKIEHFLADPLLWFDWADRYRATNTWAPNFAMAMVNERAADIAGRSWDLSCLREITNGGEPVIAATSHRFLALLAPHGLPADAMVPAWGMSETCSGITYTRQSLDDPAAGTVAVDPASFGESVRHLPPDHPDAVVLSRVGRPVPGVRLRIVDEDGTVLPEGRMGELRVTGATIMARYFGNEEANREAFDDQGWFRTGDLAFVTDGEVVIAGRRKDQIIVRGINYMAHELESVVERVDGVRVTFSAAAGVREPGAATDQLVVFFVPVSWDADALAATKEQARAILVRESGIAPDLLVPVTEGEFHKTASGKIQRAALVADLRSGRFADRVADPAAEEDPAPDTWFTTRQWVPLDDTAPPADGAGPGVTVVLGEDADLERLGLDGPFVAVRRGGAFAQELPYRYRVPVADRAELKRLLASVTERYGAIGTVVHALSLARSGEPAERLATATAELTALLAALADGDSGRPRLLVLTSGAFHVRGGDRVDLGTCALPGFVRTAIGEAAPLPVKQLDLPAADPGSWAAALRAELRAPQRTGLVAAREGVRLQPRLAPLDTGGPDGPAPADPVTPGGLYLVTGGLGGIAHDIAGYLLASYGVRLLLVGRSPAEGDRGERLAALARLGEVAYERLDVADADAVGAAIGAAEQRWGRPLDGVLHLAAADPTGQWADLDRHLIVNESPEVYAEQYRAKVEGTLALARALEDRPDASLVLFGSVNGEFGGHSFGAYATASSFLAGFAEHWHHDRGRRVHCLAWSQWTGVGMNRDRSQAAAEHRGFRSIDPDTGLRLFLESTALPGPYTIVGLDPRNPAVVAELVPQRLRVGEIVLAYVADGADPGALRDALATGPASPVPVRLVPVPRIPRDAYGEVDAARLLADTAPERARRRATPPREGLESELARLWSDALVRADVGRDESFFELGGNSLRATRLLALTEQKLGVRVTTQELYENPTVAGMATVVAQHAAG
ncbi:SDR family NAD(P)-dependent oxidoreductase [Streptomyces sp. MH60]|uniref:SDR family NAD(P)-dependent oxidoreductase n=1 Tax=Streptomyces sp. MH60 TaxID=1940758 RepID=UPI000CEE684C|nr:SDR family NAD(P)-dependent oxidoreductase [Streptomyces sp. MH60]PPS81432.1 Polyketide synthase PksJ [Streptomyces sp. MH60]